MKGNQKQRPVAMFVSLCTSYKNLLKQYSKLIKNFSALFDKDNLQEKFSANIQCWGPECLFIPQFRTKTSNPLQFHFPFSQTVLQLSKDSLYS